MAELKDKRLFLLDMDGTIYLDEQLFDGTLDFLAHVQRIDGRAMYLTNNSSRSTDVLFSSQSDRDTIYSVYRFCQPQQHG